MIRPYALPVRALLLTGLAHLVPVLWLFRGVVFAGEVPYFRDIGFYYYPNYVFLARSASQGVWWPLWNPTSDAGAPFLVAYPLDLVSVWLLGAEGALRLGPPLHIWLALCGASWLAARVGAGALGAWAAGLFFGLSGYVLSAVNLFELSHGVAWAPWVAAAVLGLLEAPTARRSALLAMLAAIQASTLSTEVIVQTGVLVLALSRWQLLRRAWAHVAAAGAAAVLLALPALLGTLALVQGTRRAQGFAPEVSFAWSVAPAALFDTIVPSFFGDPHTFTGRSYWGQSFFPEGFPYLLSLYLGLPVVTLAIGAGRAGLRLWGVVLVGTLLAMGAHGPLEVLLSPLMRSLRGPVKFFVLATLPLCLLAGLGLERVRRGITLSRPWALIPGLLLLAGSVLCLKRPWLVGWLFGDLLPELQSPLAFDVVAKGWPGALSVSGSLATGVGLLLWAAPRQAALAAVLAGLDLLIVNGNINTSTTSAFYELRPAISEAVREAAAEGRYRWFSYGIANSPGLAWSPEVIARESDVWLYYLDRQSLIPRTHVLDGLEGAFDEDRVGWSPEDSTLTGRERRPALYPSHHHRLRLANVRWVVSFLPLPEPLVVPRREVRLAETVAPLRLYELRDALPRAFGVKRHEVLGRAALRGRVLAGDFDPREVVLLEGEPAAAAAAPTARTGNDGLPRVSYESPDPHTVRLHFEGQTGFIVVLDGHHPAWSARDGADAVPLWRAYGRYWALPAPPGERTVVVRYAPKWVRPALLGSAVALVGCVVVALGGTRLDRPRPSG
jgi:hypothetical protein